MEIYATEEKQEYMPLLLLADEQQSMVEKYLAAGTMYVLADEGEVRAECVVTDAGNGILEIMNIAVAPAWQGRGYGKNSLNTWKIGIERPMTGFRWGLVTVR